MTTALDRLLDLLLEAGCTVERIELTEAGARELLATGDRARTFRYDGRLYHRGVVVEAGDRSRIVAQAPGGPLAFPLPERVAL